MQIYTHIFLYLRVAFAWMHDHGSMYACTVLTKMQEIFGNHQETPAWNFWSGSSSTRRITVGLSCCAIRNERGVDMRVHTAYVGVYVNHHIMRAEVWEGSCNNSRLRHRAKASLNKHKARRLLQGRSKVSVLNNFSHQANHDCNIGS